MEFSRSFSMLFSKEIEYEFFFHAEERFKTKHFHIQGMTQFYFNPSNLSDQRENGNNL